MADRVFWFVSPQAISRIRRYRLSHLESGILLSKKGEGTDIFIVKCTNCGHEQEWKAGVNVCTAEIQIAGFSVFCSCGAIVMEEDDVLREAIVDPNEV